VRRLARRYVRFIGALRLQTLFRGWRLRRRWVEHRADVVLQFRRREAAVMLQTLFRGWRKRVWYTRHRAASLLQMSVL
jgi:hypothetical protein